MYFYIMCHITLYITCYIGAINIYLYIAIMYSYIICSVVTQFVPNYDRLYNSEYNMSLKSLYTNVLKIHKVLCS